MSKTVTTRLDDESVLRIDEMAARRGVDRAALLRSFFMYALEHQVIKECLSNYEAGRITLWEAAEQCNLSLWEMIREVKRNHVHGSYDLQELQKDLERIEQVNG